MERKLWWIKILVSSVFVFSYFNVYCQDIVAITQSSNLRINLQGIRNNKGVILLSLFSSAEGYPSDASKADQKIRMPVKKLQLPIVFKKIKPGKYAIALLHDEDEDGKMATTVLGLPKEGYGFSNNVMGLAGPPSYQKASFIVPASGTEILIKVRY
jgi:uncharacterized protein (DUF2141 family)